ncbi:hypothetical protein AFCDBAGC_5175 [Methylobacterium cerastii]|uniref:Radical SAM core domain-containing protein n=1 Tax=Methylobacterium cerastii TaxID=932741 RepID=A0ABQ4QQ07_9HYPH|nr:radical SAM protein [Methylobacterium cerastii]GJD47282.1 hypothetical protein AFCDBAGC_5175 [Methylobacterium cerastii]
MRSIFRNFIGNLISKRQGTHFSEKIYLRQSIDLQVGLAGSGPNSGYEHFIRYGETEGRPHTFRRLRPGQTFIFDMALPKKALTGFEIYLGNEKAEASDFFELSLFDNGNAFYKTKLPYGAIALNHSTYILTGSITGLSEGVQVALSIPKTAKNDIWLLTKGISGHSAAEFKGVAFFDDPNTPNSGAIAISLSPVSQCNQNCPHCISKFSRQSFNKLSEKSQNEIRGLAQSGRISHISVDYSGDPFFTNARYFPLFDFIDELKCPFRIDTNGAYVDEENMRRVARSRLFAINFSLDAATGETHRRLRPGKISFETIIENIRLSIKILQETGRDDVMTSANFSIMRSNVDEVFDFVTLCQQLNLKNVNFSHVHVYQDDTNSESLSNFPEIYNEVYNKLLAQLLASGLTFHIPPPYLQGLETHGRRRCFTPWESAVILSNGDVQACCVPGTKIGNLHTSSFDQIWSSKEAQKFRQQATSPDGAICSQCAFFAHRGISEITSSR